MELTLKSYYYFADEKGELGDGLNRPESWDILRMREDSSLFSIPKERENWQRVCLNNPVLKLRAKEIAKILGTRFNCVYSFGVGVGCLEFLIKKENPVLQLKCSDFASKAVERLKKIFVEADEITNFDILYGNWDRIEPESICLFCRVDTELSDQQWREVLRKMRLAGVKNILFIPGYLLSVAGIIHQQIKYAIFRSLGREMTFSGYMRTKKRFISLLSEFFEIEKIVQIHDLPGFLLTAKDPLA